MQDGFTLILKRYWQKIILFACTCILLGFVGYLAHATSQSQRFGDEVAHMVGGHYVLQGKTLYEELQFNHQPSVYFFSALVEKVTSPSNLYYYIARQREGVFVYGALWILLLVWFFGRRGLYFASIFELSKYFFQGFKLLGESIAVYPTVFLIMLFLDLLLVKKKPSWVQLIIASMSLFIVVFSLFQMWLFAALMTLIFSVAIWKENRKELVYFLGPGAVLTATLFIFVPFNDYIRETITNVFTYFVPGLERTATFWTTILFPFSTLIPPYASLPQIVMALGTAGLLLYMLLLRKKLGLKLLLVIGVVWSTNTRADLGWYDSFHLLPWFGTLVATVVFLDSYWIDNLKVNKMIHRARFVILASVLAWLVSAIPNPIEAKQKALNENYVNYSYSETFGRAVKIMKDEGDTMLVIENDPIVYWVADVDMATSVLEYYSWVLIVPQYKAEVIDVFSTSIPPTFVVNTGFFDNSPPELQGESTTTVAQKLSEEMHKNYLKLDYEHTMSLYVHKDKIPQISADERQQLESMMFYLPAE